MLTVAIWAQACEDQLLSPDLTRGYGWMKVEKVYVNPKEGTRTPGHENINQVHSQITRSIQMDFSSNSRRGLPNACIPDQLEDSYKR